MTSRAKADPQSCGPEPHGQRRPRLGLGKVMEQYQHRLERTQIEICVLLLILLFGGLLRGRFETRMSGAQLIERRLSFFQIERIEASGEPAVGQSKQIGCLNLLSLIASRHAHHWAQFSRLCQLPAQGRAWRGTIYYIHLGSRRFRDLPRRR
jgi:hypothetical protein